MSKCTSCNGLGQIKTPYHICSNCNGKTCELCNNTGYQKGWWYKCPDCLYGIKKLNNIEKLLDDFAELCLDN